MLRESHKSDVAEEKTEFNTEKHKFLFFLAACFYATIKMFVSALCFGFLFSSLWNWYVIYLFSLPKINFAQMAGFFILADFIREWYREMAISESQADFVSKKAILVLLAVQSRYIGIFLAGLAMYYWFL